MLNSKDISFNNHITYCTGLSETSQTYKWEATVSNIDSFTIQSQSAPNWFFRFTWRYILGIKWKKIVDN